MKAVRVHSYNEAAVLDDVDEPEVQGPLDVLVEIGGAGLCRTDLHIIEGQWAEKSGVELPYIIGHENAGWVREVGSAVTNVVAGDAVICHPLATCGLCRACRAGDDVHCESSAFPGIDSDGGMADYLHTNARSVVKLAPSLEPADVAALADAGLTAYHAVRKQVPFLSPGTHVVNLGAGGLGHIGIQCLVAMTASEITVVDSNQEALDLATQLGAHHTVLADGNQVDAVQEITQGGAQVVIDYVGENGTEAQGVAMLRRAGNYCVVGYGGHVDVPTIDIISTEINIIGNLVGSYNDLAELMSLAAAGQVKLHTRQYPLDQYAQAIEDLDNGQVRGRAILIPHGT
ncbi:MAG: NAD(P)-dependent alcohol dehydrogenase [Actinomycetota bacterium]|nr:NAD(P)-dependent alcohol dehydrogenase [Actinomycetota bacterium]